MSKDLPNPTHLSMTLGEERKQGVGQMFDRIASRYDLLNHLLSGGMDILWRRKAVRMLAPKAGQTYIDLAAGTGDYAFTMLKQEPACRVLALDLAPKMLQVMAHKVAKSPLQSRLGLVQADAECMPLPDAAFAGLTIGYGIRNFPDKRRALFECGRVLKPGAHLVILEIAGIPNPFLRRIFNLYFRFVLPLLGRLISGDSMAYKYLPESVKQFPSRSTFLSWMQEAGFQDTKAIELHFGISTIFFGTKRLNS
jgi:demethylmenaquinone methyltransferase / 2-methoxy-6-polyprenyl-1,4-benzoquinol methylase